MYTVASELAGSLRGGDTLLLTGPLGAGKTTFVQELAKVLGVREPVTSPTFTVAGEYSLPDGRTLVHVDLYRLAEGAPSDPAVLEILEHVNHPQRITVIEWAEFLPDVEGKKIVFEHRSTPNERIVTIVS